MEGEVRLPSKTIRDTRTRLQEIDQIIKTTQALMVHYTDIARALGISPARANTLLRLYAELHGYPYKRGYLVLREPKVFITWEEVKPSGERATEGDTHGGR